MTGLVITNSLVKNFKGCQQATKYQYVDLLAPKVFRSKPLKRGIWFHELLEARYSKHLSVPEVHQANCAQFAELLDEEKEALGDLPNEMAALYRSYMWYYRSDTSWKVHEVELKLEAELPNGQQGQGKADALIEDEHGDLWFVDHKTHERLPGWDYRLLDPQAPLYIWMGRQAGIPVRGFIWNYVVPKAPMPLRFKLNGGLSKVLPAVTDYPTVAREWPKEIRPYLHQDVRDVLTKLEKVRYDPEVVQVSPIFRRDFLEPDEATIDRVIADICASGENYEEFRQGLALYPDRVVPRSVGRSCEWCDYKRLCIAELTGQNAAGIRHREFKTRDPFDYYEVRTDVADVQGLRAGSEDES